MKKLSQKLSEWQKKVEFIKERRKVKYLLGLILLLVVLAILTYGFYTGWFGLKAITTLTSTTAAQATYSDSQGNSYSSRSNDFTLVITVIDSQSPTTPTDLIATQVSYSQVVLSWLASSDNVGVIGYNIFRDSLKVATSATNSYTDIGLVPETTYSYQVSAFDAASNTSGLSNRISVTTETAPAQTEIKGRVTDIDDGSAISGATVTLSIPGKKGKSGKIAATTTAADGNYQLTNLADGTYIISVSAKGYESQTQTLTVLAGQSQAINFALNKKIRGRW